MKTNDVSTHYWGVIKPNEHGEWRWPFRRMKVGDFFYVRHADRDPERLRTMCSVRAAQLGIRLKVEKNLPAPYAGSTKVTRVSDVREPNLRTVMDYGAARQLLDEHYGIDADALSGAWSMLDIGQFERVTELRTVRDHRRCILVEFEDRSFAVELLDDGIVIERISQGETLEGWKARKLAAMLE